MLKAQPTRTGRGEWKEGGLKEKGDSKYFTMSLPAFLDGAALEFPGGWERLPSQKGQLGFRLQVNQRSRVRQEWQENGVLSALKSFIISSGVCGQVGTICFYVSLSLSQMKLLSDVSFLKSLYALVCTALIPVQVTTCDVGTGWTFLRWSLALVRISSCAGFGASRRQQPSHLTGLRGL